MTMGLLCVRLVLISVWLVLGRLRPYVRFVMLVCIEVWLVGIVLVIVGIIIMVLYYASHARILVRHVRHPP